MNDAVTAPSSPIDRLKARLLALAVDPRVRLVPDGRVIVLEIRAALVELEELGRRVGAIEGVVATLHHATFGGPECG